MSLDILAKYNKSPSFTFRGKFNNKINQNTSSGTPSPDKYKPQKLLKNQPKTVFPKSHRKTFFDVKVQKSPGPGQYEESSSLILKHSLSQNDKKLRSFPSRFHQKQQTKPGPGTYTINNDFRKTLPTFSMASKFKTLQQIQTEKNMYKPSPGAYETDLSKINSSSIISIPKSPRMKTNQSILPGPGKYDINFDLFSSQRSFGKRSFASSKKQFSFQIKNQSPGRNFKFISAGKYLFQSGFQANRRMQKGFSCRKLFQSIKRQKSPGPGDYCSESFSKFKFKTSLSCKILASQKKLLQSWKSSEVPGPGNYQNTVKHYEKANFTQALGARFSKGKLQSLSSIKLRTTDKFYDTKYKLVQKSAASFNIGSEIKKSKFDNVSSNPSPCEYNPETKLIQQKVLAPKFPKSLRSQSVLNSLKAGPGEYFNDDHSSSLIKKGTKFSKGKRVLQFNSKQHKSNSIYRISSNSSHLNKTTGILAQSSG